MFPFETDREDRPWFLALAGVALAEIIVLFALAWRLAGGHFMLPLDDSYIHLQYAKMLAAGEPLVYTAGMLPSGGMTSPLYVLLLAPFQLLGFHGARGAFVAFLFGAAMWMLLPIWTYQLVKRLSNCLCGLLAAGLALANGHLLWNFLSGMETALYTMLLLGMALGAQAWWQSEKRHGLYMMLACAALLPLTRPEGLFAPAALILIVLLRRGEQPRISLPLLLATVIPFALWIALVKTATGDWRPAGLIVKGLTANPYLDMAGKVAMAGETLTHVAYRYFLNLIPDPVYATFKGTQTMPYIAPGIALLALFGGAFTAAAETRGGRPTGGTLLFLLFVGGLATLAASALPFIHQQRYLAPYSALAIVLAMIGVWRIGQLFQQREETAIKGIGLGLLVLSLPSVPFWMTEFGRNGRDIFALIRVSTFTLEHHEEPFALTDAGVLAYYTNAPVWDLVGLASQQFPHAVAHGEGSTLEALARVPSAQRPSTLVGYRDWFSPTFPLDNPEWLVSIPRTTITSGLAMGRHPIRWDEIERGMAPPIAPGRGLLLDLDVASLESEAEHHYEPIRGLYDVDLKAWPQPLSPVGRLQVPEMTAEIPSVTTATLVLRTGGWAVDGGRVVRGERFLFAPPRFPDGELRLHARVAPPRDTLRFAPRARALHFRFLSNTTGYAVERRLDIPREGLADLVLDLGDVFDEAGGTAWWIEVRAEPSGAAWESYHYWITSRWQD